MLEILTRITEGRGEEKDIKRLERLSIMIKKASLCGLGQSAPNPVLSTLKNFREEYLEHVRDKKCRPGSCKKLISYEITDKCVGCTACAKICSVSAISGNLKKKHTIDRNLCIKCGLCIDTCKFNAIIKI